MKLYYSPGACSLAPHIALLEAGLKVEIEKVDLQSKKFAGGDYREVNPKGSVPALVMENGELLTEGAVILQYIADLAPNAKLAPKSGTTERYRLEEWLNYVASEIHKGFSILFGADKMVSNSEGNTELKKAGKEALEKKFTFLAERLEKKEYLLGAQFSVADAYLFTCLRWARIFQMDLTRWPAISQYMERIKARPSVEAALRAESPKH